MSPINTGVGDVINNWNGKTRDRKTERKKKRAKLEHISFGVLKVLH